MYGDDILLPGLTVPALYPMWSTIAETDGITDG